jgi:hypothetical protein
LQWMYLLHHGVGIFLRCAAGFVPLPRHVAMG